MVEMDLKFFCCPMDNNIIDLRHQALKLGKLKSSSIFDKDFLKSTMHFVVYTPDSPRKPVGCVSYFLDSFEGVPAYQLRGMAVTKEFQGLDIEKRLVNFAEETIREQKDVSIFVK